jgi:hypothetical protein
MLKTRHELHLVLQQNSHTNSDVTQDIEQVKGRVNELRKGQKVA